MFGISLARISLLTGTSLGGGVGVSPTLDLNFRGQGYSAAMTAYTFDQIIDYTRTSAATYVANTGFVTQTPASRNLLTYTQEFDNAAWAKSNANAYPFDPAAATLGPEVISNGDFATTASWALAATAPATATIAGGKLTLVSPAGEAASAFQAVLTVGKWYKVTGDVTVRSGTVKVICGGPTEYYFTATQSFTIYAQANGNTSFSLSRQGACDADFDNISVREVIGGLITAPDGTLTGDALVAAAGTGARNCVQTAGGSGSALTLSLYTKAGTSNFVQLYHASSGTIFANFNLATGAVGTVGAGATAAITSVGSGWYRCAITFTPGSSGASRIGMITSATATYAESWTATGTETIYIWGAQLEAASTATTYTRNVGGVYPPRFDYDPVTLAPRGLLIEEQRTNLLLRSEEFENASWVKGNATVTANSTTAPDGSLTADAFIPNSGQAAATLAQSISVGLASHSFSFYAKAFGQSSISLVSNLTGTFRATILDLTTETATPGTGWSASVVSVGNGWYRCVCSATADVAASKTFQISNNSAGWTGDGTSGIYLWGAQLEAGAFATSYIPTVASQVTRTGDIAGINAPNFSRWYNQSEGTFVVEASKYVTSVDGYLFSADSGSTSNFVGAGVTGAAGFLNITTGGAAQAFQTAGTITANGVFKLAAAAATNDAIVAVNGAISVGDTVVTMPAADRLRLGAYASGGTIFNGHIRRIRYYPTRLSNTQLQALTA